MTEVNLATHVFSLKSNIQELFTFQQSIYVKTLKQDIFHQYQYYLILWLTCNILQCNTT